MKRINSLALPAALCFFVWVFPGAPVSSFARSNPVPSSQQPQPQQPVPQPPKTQQQPAQQQPNTPQAETPNQNQQQTVMLTGTIVQKKGQFVLQDSGRTYKLDAQDQAKKYENRKVRVMGTLNTASRTLQVTEIKPAT
ncbi:MAG: DUF5818 domain-containing protein [Terriglobia bacterium]